MVVVIVNLVVIVNFKDSDAKALYETGRSRRVPSDIQRVALRKLTFMNRAKGLDDLRLFPGNRLEALSGDRKGQHSIRINDRYRICFVWDGTNCHDVEIVDYH